MRVPFPSPTTYAQVVINRIASLADDAGTDDARECLADVAASLVKGADQLQRVHAAGRRDWTRFGNLTDLEWHLAMANEEYAESFCRAPYAPPA